MKTLHLIWLYFKLNLSSAVEYRAAFLTQSIGMVINNASFIFFWWVAFGRIGQNIGGYDFRDVMFIWALCASAFGLAHIVFGNLNLLTRMIVTGEMDMYLTQPKEPLVSMLCSRMDFTAWGDLAYGFILFALTGQGLGALPVFLAGTLTGALLCVAICVTAHTLSFYFGDASLAGSLALEFVINFSIYPLGIYPIALRAVMFTLIPAAFVTHVPLAIVRSASPGLLLGLLGVTGLYCSMAWWFFHRGLRRYESGNLIRTRL